LSSKNAEPTESYGQVLASASSDKTVRLWDATTGAWKETLEGRSDRVSAVAFSPDGKVLASAMVHMIRQCDSGMPPPGPGNRLPSYKVFTVSRALWNLVVYLTPSRIVFCFSFITLPIRMSDFSLGPQEDAEAVRMMR
jgi:WD40 repeat protein